MPRLASPVSKNSLAELREALHRIEPAAVAVDPFVVAGNDHEGVRRLLELVFARCEPLIVARTPAAGDVADVDHEGELLPVHLLDHRVERRGLGLAVRRIADQREGDGRMERGRQQRRNVRRAGREGEKQGDAQTSQERRSCAEPPGRGCYFFVTRKKFVTHNFGVVFRRKRSNKPVERIGSRLERRSTWEQP